jgi:hypothetical protein
MIAGLAVPSARVRLVICAGTRRLSRCTAFAGYPDDCREAKSDRQGWIRCEGLRVYISYALGGWTVGLQRVADGSTRVWFFRMLLGAFLPGRDTTIQPCAATADDVTLTNSAADPNLTRAE